MGRNKLEVLDDAQERHEQRDDDEANGEAHTDDKHRFQKTGKGLDQDIDVQVVVIRNLILMTVPTR